MAPPKGEAPADHPARFEIKILTGNDGFFP